MRKQISCCILFGIIKFIYEGKYKNCLLYNISREWDEDDSFVFAVEKHVSKDEHTVIEEVTVDYDDDDKTADFAGNADERYTEPGTYSYRVVERPGDLAGIAYDSAICYFDIVVADDGEGHLYIADVIGRQDVTVEHNDTDNTWDVTAEFFNIYNAEGSVQVSLSVVKDVENLEYSYTVCGSVNGAPSLGNSLEVPQKVEYSYLNSQQFHS